MNVSGILFLKGSTILSYLISIFPFKALEQNKIVRRSCNKNIGTSFLSICLAKGPRAQGKPLFLSLIPGNRFGLFDK